MSQGCDASVTAFSCTPCPVPAEHSLGGKGAQGHPSMALMLLSPRCFCTWGAGTAGFLSSLPPQFCDSMDFAEDMCSQARHRFSSAFPRQSKGLSASPCVGPTEALTQTQLPWGGSASRIPAVPNIQKLWLPPALPSLRAGDRLWKFSVLSLSW